MSLSENLALLSVLEIESIEKLTLRWIFQALLDFGMEAYEIFLYSPDEVKDVAEDVTREVLDRLSGYNVQQRIFGTVDYKKARYIILPNQTVRQALFVDSKAEKDSRTATIQMSQTSMHVKQIRSNVMVEVQGHLPPISTYNDKQYLTTTALIHFKYRDMSDNRHVLEQVTAACLPNGLLQEVYNPTAFDTIWLAGRNAPSRGEDFRVRLNFNTLATKARWRVQRITYNSSINLCYGEWKD